MKLPKSRIRALALLALAAFWVAAGANHFINPEFYLQLMPPWIPAHEAMVFWSGVAEVAGGIAVLIPAWRARAGVFLILVLIGVTPANLHMALNPGDFAELGPAWVFWVRLPIQVLFGLWAWWATRPDPSA
ncbi:MAG: hypothetical protein JJ896_00220 [Rhodothermales bacterium]|nr:hypothetical protein [Rhodothermales bacterium]MBO6778051.1 hypothetical protein [Rhodothermales bacterium]